MSANCQLSQWSPANEGEYWLFTIGAAGFYIYSSRKVLSLSFDSQICYAIVAVMKPSKKHTAILYCVFSDFFIDKSFWLYLSAKIAPVECIYKNIGSLKSESMILMAENTSLREIVDTQKPNGYFHLFRFTCCLLVSGH